MYVVPDGERTWFAFGENETVVLAKVKAALDGAPPAGTLTARAGLDALHTDAPAMGGGFMTVEGMALLSIQDRTDDQPRDADRKLTRLRG
jgi:hypothetical protein